MVAQENALLIKVNGRAYSVTTCSSSNNIILAVGLENFNERLKHPEGFYLGNAARERKWNTSNSKLIYNGFCRYSLRSPDN